MSLFSERVWKNTTPLRQKIHSMPFNAELASGTLSRDRFQYYIIQDLLISLSIRASWRWPLREAPIWSNCKPLRNRHWAL